MVRMVVGLTLLTTASCASAPPDEPPSEDCSPTFSYLEQPFEGGPYGRPITPIPITERPEGTIFAARVAPVDPSTVTELAYWLSDGEDVELDVMVAVGTGFGARFFEGTALVSFFVNGSLTPASTSDGTSWPTLQIPLVEGLGQVRVRIPGSFFPQGGNLFHWYARLQETPVDNELLFPLSRSPRAEMVLARGSELVFTGIPDTEGYAPATDALGFTRVVFRDRELMGYEVELLTSDPPTEGAYRVRLDVATNHTARCPGQSDKVMVVALLDGHELPLTPDGPVVATVAPGELRSFELDLTGLPSDGRDHRLEVLELFGFAGAPVADDGRSASWGEVTRLVGLARYR